MQRTYSLPPTPAHSPLVPARPSDGPTTCRLSLFLAGLLALGAMAQAQTTGPVPGLDPGLALTQYVLDDWTVDDGLPQNSVTAVLRTRDGFLWVGTQEGLARFDGLSFRISRRGLPSSFVSALHESGDGTLWVGTYTGLVRVEDEGFSVPVLGLLGDHISALASDADGALWVGTYDGGLSRIAGGAVEGFTLDDGMPETTVMDLAVAPGGAVWIATRTEGLVRYLPQEDRFTTFTTADGLPDAALTSLALDGETLWITTETGLVRYDGTFTTFTAEDGLPVSNLREGIVASGALWLGGTLGGLARYTLADGAFSLLTAENGLPAGKVGTLHADAEGTLWIGTDSGGLGRLRAGLLVPFSTPEGLADPYVWSVYEDAEGTLWVGTEGGLNRLRPTESGGHGEVATFTVEDGLPSNRLIAVRGTRDGALWAGTQGHGLVRYQDGAFTTFTTDDGLPSESVYALYEDRADALWIGTGSGLVRYRDGAFTTFTTDDGLSSNLITVVGEDAKGCLLVGTYDGGLNVLCGETVVRQVTTQSGLPSDVVLSLHIDRSGVVWAGLLGGLARIEGEAVRSFTEEDGLYSDKILQLFEDRSGRFWISSNRGLFRVDKAALDAAADGQRAAIRPVVYGRATGRRSPEFNGGVQPAGWQSPDGTLWFPSTEGLMALRPSDLTPLPVSTPRIDRFRVDRKLIDLDVLAPLPPGDGRLQFHYVAPTFVAPERLHYRYRLEGVDAGWVDAGDRQEAFYTNIPPGSYTFRVQAVSDQGVTSETQALAFELRPHYYQTGWFLALCLLGGLWVLYLVYVLRVRLLVARQRELEDLVEERTEDLRDTNHRLVETSELKSQLMHMVAHDLKNPLNGVHEIAKLLRTELEDDAPQQEFVTLVEEAAEEMLSLVLRFLDVEALESNTLNIEPQPVDLAATAQEAGLRFAGAAERKGQHLTVEPSSAPVPLVRADPTWLKEVVDNLVSNALKFTPPGKRIRVHTEGVAGGARFVVQDEGPGLTPDDLAKMFGKFQRLSAQPTAGESSSGLGLSIVKRVVELLDGRVWAENAPEGGSRFVVELPAADADLSPAESPASEARAASSGDGARDGPVDDEFDLGGILIEG